LSLAHKKSPKHSLWVLTSLGDEHKEFCAMLQDTTGACLLASLKLRRSGPTRLVSSWYFIWQVFLYSINC